MNVPFFSLEVIHDQLKQEIQDALSRVINNSMFVRGEMVKTFEGDWSGYVGNRRKSSGACCCSGVWPAAIFTMIVFAGVLALDFSKRRSP